MKIRPSLLSRGLCCKVDIEDHCGSSVHGYLSRHWMTAMEKLLSLVTEAKRLRGLWVEGGGEGKCQHLNPFTDIKMQGLYVLSYSLIPQCTALQPQMLTACCEVKSYHHHADILGDLLR